MFVERVEHSGKVDLGMILREAKERARAERERLGGTLTRNCAGPTAGAL